MVLPLRCSSPSPPYDEINLNAPVRDDGGASLLGPAKTLGHDVGLAGLGIVLAGAAGILEGRKLVAAVHLHAGKLVEGKQGEAVKDELLELDAVGLGGLDELPGLEIGGGDLLAGDVVGQLVRPPGDALQEAERVVVVDDVGRAELEQMGMAGVASLGSLLVDLGVLDNVGLAVLAENQADRLGGVALPHNLGGNVDVEGGREADEDGVGNLDQAVVDAVGVDVLDAALAHVVQDAGDDEGLVDAAVAVGGDGHLALALQEDLALVGDARQDALLEDLDIVLVEPEEVVVGEEVLGGPASRTAGHDIPGDHDLGDAGPGGGQLLDLADALGLDLEEGLVRGQANVEAALGGRASQPGSLAAGHEHDGHLVAADEVQAGLVPLVDVDRARVEDAGPGRCGQGLEPAGALLDLGRVQRSAGDVVDVGRVEAGKLLEEGGFLGRAQRVVEREDMLLSGLGVLVLELGDGFGRRLRGLGAAVGVAVGKAVGKAIGMAVGVAVGGSREERNG
ncbi:hypothetical protein Trco_002665 [Trichoderma cornu-damae]|uniref:Uncharacterized protein n=1 Tax=Trichoderma cornu-damae TaxID=654480 RepID=A0A9P8TY16_9HYPO|nr:hypothetical protein Trco_002665 [Trichoderma cornu-damae]